MQFIEEPVIFVASGTKRIFVREHILELCTSGGSTLLSQSFSHLVPAVLYRYPLVSVLIRARQWLKITHFRQKNPFFYQKPPKNRSKFAHVIKK